MNMTYGSIHAEVEAAVAEAKAAVAACEKSWEEGSRVEVAVAFAEAGKALGKALAAAEEVAALAALAQDEECELDDAPPRLLS